jgi:hypothetical protein
MAAAPPVLVAAPLPEVAVGLLVVGVAVPTPALPTLVAPPEPMQLVSMISSQVKPPPQSDAALQGN